MVSFVVVLFGSVGSGLSLCLRRLAAGWTRSVFAHGLVKYVYWYCTRVDLNLVQAGKIRCRVLEYRVDEASVLRVTCLRKFRDEFVLSLRANFVYVGPYGFEIKNRFLFLRNVLIGFLDL